MAFRRGERRNDLPGDGPGDGHDNWKKRPGRSSTSAQRGKQHKFNREQARVFSIQSLGQGQFRFVGNYSCPEGSWYLQ